MIALVLLRRALRPHVALAAGILTLATSCATAQFAPPAPEAASGLTLKSLVTARRHMVVAANPLAAEAGLEILNAGGSAVDAMIATQLVLNLVEPQSSGLGGGALLMTWNPQRGELKSYDGRETAPAAAMPNQFLKADGTPLSFFEAALGGQSVGVPGTVHLLETAYRAHGRLPWGRLFEPAVKLAEAGFPVSARLHTLLSSPETGGIATFGPAMRALYLDSQGKAWPPGHILKNPDLANTLRAIAAAGKAAFYDGPVASAIINAVTGTGARPSGMTLADLAAYSVKERPPVCATYRRHRICGMGPPSSGALTVGATLALLEPFDLGAQPMHPRALHLIAEAEKLAFADRDRYIADPGFMSVPTGLLDRAYLAQRRALINADKAMSKALPGEPPGQIGQRAGLDATIEAAGTSHVSIIDDKGNAVALTTTIEQGFGSRIMAAGFLLNNELTDFSFRPVDADGRTIANAVAPGKRPRSSMAPTFVFAPNGRLRAVIGSAGAAYIILHVVKTIVGIIDWQLDAQAAVDLPNFGSRNGPFEIEGQLAGALTGLKMIAYGHRVQNVDLASGLHVIVRRPNGVLEGGADPRREGLAKGE